MFIYSKSLNDTQESGAHSFFCSSPSQSFAALFLLATNLRFLNTSLHAVVPIIILTYAKRQVQKVENLSATCLYFRNNLIHFLMRHLHILQNVNECLLNHLFYPLHRLIDRKKRIVLVIL